MTGRVRGDRLEVPIDAAETRQVAAQSLEPRRDDVDVRIAEAGRDRPAAELDHTGTRTDPRTDLGVRSDGGDAAAASGEGLDPWPDAVHRLDPAAEQDEIRGWTVLRGHRRRMPVRRRARATGVPSGGPAATIAPWLPSTSSTLATRAIESAAACPSCAMGTR